MLVCREAGGLVLNLSMTSSPQIVQELVRSILLKTPEPINLQSVMAKYPVLYEESMNTVLVQEVIR